MAAAFCASLGLAVGIVAVLGIERGVYVALAATARLAFLIFWPAYAGGALASLFGSVFLRLREHARDLGLAFAAALSVHLGLVACLCVIGHAPGVWTFVILAPLRVSPIFSRFFLPGGCGRRCLRNTGCLFAQWQ
jgi:hypothetical protein